MIVSTTNEKVKELVKLKKANIRNEKQMFIVEGEHLVNEAKKLNLLIEAYTTKDNLEGIKVSEQVMKKICSTTSVCPIIGVCKIKESKTVSNRILLLDKISDPGNLGTLLRSAKAFGFDTVFTNNNSVDYYNDKVIRSSQGAIFKLNLLTGDLCEFIKKLSNYDIYGTNVVNGITIDELSFNKQIAIVLGNEANGVSKEVSELLNKNIYIKMNETESLNVAIAGSIIMHHINNLK